MLHKQPIEDVKHKLESELKTFMDKEFESIVDVLAEGLHPSWAELIPISCKLRMQESRPALSYWEQQCSIGNDDSTLAASTLECSFRSRSAHR